MKDQLKEVTSKLMEADRAYYNTGSSIMSDAEYDELKDYVREKCPDHPILSSVGAPVADHLTKAEHKIPMGSLNNCSRDGDNATPSFREWHARRIKDVGIESEMAELLVMHKLDGSSVELIYKDGILVQAITRGDGHFGEDITRNARKFKNVPVRIPIRSDLHVRGEAILLKEDFEKHFGDAANARNAANGTVRRSDGDRAQCISFIAFDVIGDDEFVSHSEKLVFLQSLGFEVVWFVLHHTVDDVYATHQQVASDRAGLDVEIDGLVVFFNDSDVFSDLGVRDNRPKGGIAFKFKAMEATTKLLGVKLTVGHTGAIIPTADLAPVHIGGVTVTSALLNNFEEIERLRVAVGDEVKVIRSGDVIPKVIGVANEAADREQIFTPTNCPVCFSELVKDGAHIKCMSDSCEGKQFRLLKTWITKRNILHIGDTLLETLYDNYGIRTPADLYGLTEDVLAAIPRGNGVVGSNAKRIMAELEKSKSCSLQEFWGSLGIQFLGRRQMEIMISQGIGQVDMLSLDPERLSALEGFSERKATAVCEGICGVIGRGLYQGLLDAGVRIVEEESPEAPVVSGGSLAGKCFVFTGAIEKVGEDGKRFTRKMMWDVVVRNGGTTSDKVASGVDFLVQADPSKESSKTKKARKLGVEIISESDFWGMI